MQRGNEPFGTLSFYRAIKSIRFFSSFSTLSLMLNLQSGPKLCMLLPSKHYIYFEINSPLHIVKYNILRYIKMQSMANL